MKIDKTDPFLKLLTQNETKLKIFHKVALLHDARGWSVMPDSMTPRIRAPCYLVWRPSQGRHARRRYHGAVGQGVMLSNMAPPGVMQKMVILWNIFRLGLFSVKILKRASNFVQFHEEWRRGGWPHGQGPSFIFPFFPKRRITAPPSTLFHIDLRLSRVTPHQSVTSSRWATFAILRCTPSARGKGDAAIMRLSRYRPRKKRLSRIDQFVHKARRCKQVAKGSKAGALHVHINPPRNIHPFARTASLLLPAYTHEYRPPTPDKSKPAKIRKGIIYNTSSMCC